MNGKINGYINGHLTWYLEMARSTVTSPALDKPEQRSIMQDTSWADVCTLVSVSPSQFEQHG